MTEPRNTCTEPPTPETLNELRWVAELLDDYIRGHVHGLCTCDAHCLEDSHDLYCLLGVHPVTVAMIAIDALQPIAHPPLRLLPAS